MVELEEEESASDLLKALHNRLSNVKLEKEILAHCIHVSEDQIEILTNLDQKHFFNIDHSLLFSILFEMFKARHDISGDSIKKMLVIKAKTSDIDGLTKLVDELISTKLKDTVFNSIFLIKELYRNRIVYSEIFQKANALFNENEPIDNVIDHISQAITAVDIMHKEKPTTDVVDNVVDSILNATEKDKGLSTGINDIDIQYGGIKPDTYITIAAESGVGKTAVLVDLIDRLCVRHSDKIAVLFFSMEMSESRIVKRFISRKTGMPVQKLAQKMRSLNGEERKLVEAAGVAIKNYPLEIIYATLNPAQMKARVRKFALKNPDKHLIILVDHIGLIEGEGNDLRVNTVKASSTCKTFCRDYQATTIVLSQFTKEIDSNENRKNYHIPHMGYIMESGRVRQDSDIIMLLWRPEIRFVTIPYGGDPEWKTEGKLIILNEKNRDGDAPTHMVLNQKIAINHIFNNNEPFS